MPVHSRPIENTQSSEIASKINRFINLSNVCSIDQAALLAHIEDYFEREDDLKDDSDSDSEEENPSPPCQAPDLPVHHSSTNEGELEDGEAFSPIEDIARDSLQNFTVPGPNKNTKVSSTSTRKPAELSCKCKLFDGKPCRERYSTEQLDSLRAQQLALTDAQLDLVILAKLECGIHISAETQSTRRKEQSVRKLTRTDFYLHGQSICRDMFKYMHCISQDKLTALIKHYKDNGVSERVHKNTKRLPANTIKFAEVQRIVDFVTNYAEIHAISLPGRTPQHWNSNLRLLPTNCTKKKVYDLYVQSSAPDERTVSLSRFRIIWKTILPFISTMPPATDLCWTCQEGARSVARASNLPDSQKSAALMAMEQHLVRVTAERSYLNTVLKECKANITEGVRLCENPPCSQDITMHYSFDFAQQVHYPSDPLQPGPIFFKTPRKCGLFGVSCEAVPQQINYLIDEAVSCGKGANCVVSLLHHFFENYGLGERHVHLHADNCSGQNKNSCMMQYIVWRVLTGRHASCKLSFLITGHTKFGPDGGFGLVKRLYRKTRVNSLDCVARVVEDSSVMNTAQIVGTGPEDVKVITYDWTSFLGQFFKKVTAIKSHHHFEVTDRSGRIVLKEFADSLPSAQQLLKRANVMPDPDILPDIINPEGLDNKRVEYLYNEIRQFVEDPFKDIVAPPPPTAVTPAPHPVAAAAPPAAKKARKK